MGLRIESDRMFNIITHSSREAHTNRRAGAASQTDGAKRDFYDVVNIYATYGRFPPKVPTFYMRA